MAEGPRAPLLRAVPGAPMGHTTPPESKSQPSGQLSDDDDPHQSVTIAPPAPNFEDVLRQPTPVPSLGHTGDGQFRAAIDAGNRAGLSLAELSKVVSELAGGVAGATQANERLLRELTTLRAMLGAANEEQLGLRRRISELEQELTNVRAQAEREIRFLSEQQDEFLKGLLEEHEEALRARDSQEQTHRMGADVAELTQKLVQVESARLQAEADQKQARAECEKAREALAKAQAQRDEAQARAQLRERERDELRAEASTLRARVGTLRNASTTPPPPVVSSRPPSYRPPPALELDDGELDSTLHARRSSPRIPLPSPRTPQPAELSAALYTPEPPHSSTPLPEASVFPRVSTRPGVGDGRSSSSPPTADAQDTSGWTPVPPMPDTDTATTAPPRPAVVSAASVPPSQLQRHPVLKTKPDASSRPLISYSLKDGVQSELLEGARISSKPPRK